MNEKSDGKSRMKEAIAFFRSSRAVLIFLMTAAFSISLTGVASGKTIYVKRNATGSNNGTSWSSAYTALTTAVTASVSGDQIWIATGTYRPNDAAPSNTSRAQSFQLKNGVSVYGGFAGTETSLSQRSAGSHPVVLTGDLSLNDSARNTLGQQSSASSTTENVYNVIYNPSSLALNSTAVLDSVTIRGGNATGSGVNSGGGAMYNDSCSPKITNCTFIDNNATSGGAIYTTNASPAFVNCTFGYNSATNGSAVFGSTSGAPTFINCTIANNTTGVINNQGFAIFTNCIIWGNGVGTPLTYPVRLINCDIQGSYTAGTANITTDPLLMPIGNYGGQTPTMPISAPSPAIGAGTFNGSTPTTDQRGLTRSSPPCIGACELNTVPLAVGISSPNALFFAAGYQPALTALSEGQDLTYQWYYGISGNTSNPIAGATSVSELLPPLAGSTNVWVRVTYSGGTIDSNTLSFIVGLGVIHVSTSGNDANDGSSWASAKRTLQAAINATNYGGQVWIATGTYRPNDANPSNVSPGQAFQLKNGASVYGGFAGTETLISQRDTGTHPVVLTGDLLGNDSAANTLGKQSSISTTYDNLYHVIYNPASLALDTTALLDSVTIRGGNSASTGANGNGGGMYNDTCAPKITNCTFTDNSAGYGGAVYTSKATPTFINCTFAYDSGGIGSAVAGDATATPAFINCTFAYNSTSAYGSASYNLGLCSFTNCIFWSNQGVAQLYSKATVNYCDVQGGYAGNGNISSDPLLMPMAYYGGQTPTLPVAAGSPAAGAGVANAPAPVTDQRGIARSSPPCMGACELSSVPVVAIASPQQNSTQFAIGYQPTLTVASEGGNISYQWYVGTAGDTSNPISGATSSSLILPQLTAATSIWVQVTSPGGSVNSNTISLTVGLPVAYLSTHGSDTNDGSSWATAKRTFQAANGATGYGGQVWIATGTYHPNDGNPSNLDRNQTFQLKNGVAVYGGFAGTETSLSQRAPGGNPVVMSGDLLGNDSGANQLGVFSSAETLADNAINVFYNPASLVLDSSTVLDSVVIRGGRANGGASDNLNSGAGMYCDGCSPTISNCTFTDNCAEYVGGAFYVRGGSPALVNCTFAYNKVIIQYGSAIFSPNSTFTVTNCTISCNTGATYAVITTVPGNVTLTNCILWGDTSQTEVYNEDIVVTNCILEGGFPGNLSSDPQLLPLGYYGGQTPTMPVSAGSSAIQAGLANGSVPATDQRGLPRTSPPDIGSCEYQAAGYISPAQFQASQPIAPGGTASITVYTEGFSSPAYQWYSGVAGDTSHPVSGATSSTFTTPPLGTAANYWVDITSGGTDYDSPTWSVPVQALVPAAPGWALVAAGAGLLIAAWRRVRAGS